MSIQKNKLRRLLNEGRPTVATRIRSVWPTVAEMAAETGKFDYLEFLAEYSPCSQHDMENFVRACELYHTGSLIKVDFQNRSFVAQKAIAMGFQAILFTDHHKADEVRETLRTVFPESPLSPEYGGGMGITFSRRIGYSDFSIPEYRAEKAEVVKVFMIEKKEAVENIREICSVPGVDMIQFGGYDYCMSMGWDIKDHAQDVAEIERHVIETALSCGVQPRCELLKAEQAQKYRDMGVKHFCVGEEFYILSEYWNGVCGKVRDMIGT